MTRSAPIHRESPARDTALLSTDIPTRPAIQRAATEPARIPGWDARPPSVPGEPQADEANAVEAVDAIPCTRAAAEHWLR